LASSAAPLLPLLLSLPPTRRHPALKQLGLELSRCGQTGSTLTSSKLPLGSA